MSTTCNNVNPGLINPWLINRCPLLVVGLRPLLQSLHPLIMGRVLLRSWVNITLFSNGLHLLAELLVAPKGSLFHLLKPGKHI